jgi:hypothetical protein
MLECILATTLPHGWLQGHSGYTSLGQPVTLNPLPFRWLQARTVTTSTIFFCVALLFFGRDKLKALPWSAAPLHKLWALLHASALLLFVATDLFLANAATPGTPLERAAMCAWYGLLVSLPVTLGGALIHLPRPLRLIRSLGNAWGLAAVCDVLMMSVRSLLIIAWDRPDSWLGHAMQVATFRGVEVLLGFFTPTVFTDPAHFVVGTRAFGPDVEPHRGLASLHAPRVAPWTRPAPGAVLAPPQLAAQPGAARCPHRNWKCRLSDGGLRGIPLPGRMDSLQLRCLGLPAHHQQRRLVSTLTPPSANPPIHRPAGQR